MTKQKNEQQEPDGWLFQGNLYRRHALKFLQTEGLSERIKKEGERIWFSPPPARVVTEISDADILAEFPYDTSERNNARIEGAMWYKERMRSLLSQCTIISPKQIADECFIRFQKVKSEHCLYDNYKKGFEDATEWLLHNKMGGLDK